MNYDCGMCWDCSKNPNCPAVLEDKRLVFLLLKTIWEDRSEQ